MKCLFMGGLTAPSFCTAAFMAYNMEYALIGFMEFKWFSSDNRFLNPLFNWNKTHASEAKSRRFYF